MAEVRTLDERYAAIGRELVETEEALAELRASGARIAFLSSDAKRKSRGRVVHGTCERVPARWQWAVPYDFAVCVFEPNVAHYGEAQLRTLLLHELMHAGVEHTEDGEERYRIVPHDVEDFSAILDRFGRDWSAPGAEAGDDAG